MLKFFLMGSAIYAFYVYDRRYCLYRQYWDCSAPEPEKLQKLLNGLLFSLKRFCEKISSPLYVRFASILIPNRHSSDPYKIGGQQPPFETMSTPTYKIHLYETLSGYKFVFLTHPAMPSLRLYLK